MKAQHPTKKQRENMDKAEDPKRRKAIAQTKEGAYQKALTGAVGNTANLPPYMQAKHANDLMPSSKRGEMAMAPTPEALEEQTSQDHNRSGGG